MTAKERIFYFIIIIVQFVLMALLFTRLLDFKKKSETQKRDMPPLPRAFYSFDVESKDGTQNQVRFTAYSPHYYILVSVSPGCPSCQNLLDDFSAYFSNFKPQEGILVYLLSSETIPAIDIPDNPSIRAGKITFEDGIQFGPQVPSIFAVNGKGEILALQMGYSPGIFPKMIDIIHEIKNRKTSRVPVSRLH